MFIYRTEEELIAEVKRRLENTKPEDTISEEDMMKKYGITEEDLEGYEEAVLE